jgi:hypothetical protein
MAMTCEKVRELAPGFVLGALETEEMIVVQDHLDGCVKPHPEMDEFGGVVPYLAQSLPAIEPPAWLRESVIAAAKADTRARQRVGKATEHRMAGHEPVTPLVSAVPAAPAAPDPLPANVTPLRQVWARRRQVATWSTRIAAAFLVVGLASYAVVVQGELNRTATPTTNLSMIIGQGSRQAALMPTDTASKAGGLAVLQQTGHLFIDIHGLAATTGDRVYSVWVSDSNGVVTKIGWFTVDAGGHAVQEFPNVPNSPSLWLFVTQEANSGTVKPLGPMIVSGTLSA